MRAGAVPGTAPPRPAVPVLRLVVATLLGALTLLTGWVVSSAAAAPAPAAVSASAADVVAATRLAAGAGWVSSAAGSGATFLGATSRVRSGDLVGGNVDNGALGDSATVLPWAVLAAGIVLIRGPRLRLAVTGRLRSAPQARGLASRERAPPARVPACV